MIAPTKELTQPTAAVTREVTEEIISDKKIPPLQTDEPLNQTDTETNKANDDEHENERVVSDSTNKGADPGDGTSDQRTDIVNDSSESTSSRSRSR